MMKDWLSKILGVVIAAMVATVLALLMDIRSRIDVNGVNIQHVKMQIEKQDGTLSQHWQRIGEHSIRLTKIETRLETFP